MERIKAPAKTFRNIHRPVLSIQLTATTAAVKVLMCVLLFSTMRILLSVGTSNIPQTAGTFSLKEGNQYNN